MTDELHLCRKIVEAQDDHEYVTYEPVETPTVVSDELLEKALGWVNSMAEVCIQREDTPRILATIRAALAEFQRKHGE